MEEGRKKTGMFSYEIFENIELRKLEADCLDSSPV